MSISESLISDPLAAEEDYGSTAIDEEDDMKETVEKPKATTKHKKERREELPKETSRRRVPRKKYESSDESVIVARKPNVPRTREPDPYPPYSESSQDWENVLSRRQKQPTTNKRLMDRSEPNLLKYRDQQPYANSDPQVPTGWEYTLNKIPVNRKEALTLLLFMKKRLVKAASDTHFYREKISSLQNQLMKKNFQEEEFIKLTQAFNQQSIDLQKLEGKTARTKLLEKTIKEQEEVIKKLESHFDDKKDDDARSKQSIEERLLRENAELRETVSDLSKKMREFREEQKMILEQNQRPSRSRPKSADDDRLREAEAKIQELQYQLDMKNKNWFAPPASPNMQFPMRRIETGGSDPLSIKNNHMPIDLDLDPNERWLIDQLRSIDVTNIF